MRSEADVERVIREIWETVLDRPVTGSDQSFFDMGGTSVQLIRLHRLLDQRFPGRCRAAQLFSFPTIAGQARLVEPALARTEDEVSEYDF